MTREEVGRHACFGRAREDAGRWLERSARLRHGGQHCPPSGARPDPPESVPALLRDLSSHLWLWRVLSLPLPVQGSQSPSPCKPSLIASPRRMVLRLKIIPVSVRFGADRRICIRLPTLSGPTFSLCCAPKRPCPLSFILEVPFCAPLADLCRSKWERFDFDTHTQ